MGGSRGEGLLANSFKAGDGFRYGDAQDLGSGRCHEDVIFDANAAKGREFVNTFPIDSIGERLAPLGVLDDGGDEIDAGLDGDDVPFGEWQVRPEPLEPEAVAWRASGQAPARIVGRQAEHV